MSTQFVTIAATTLRLSRRELAKGFGTSEARVKAAAIVAFVLSAVFGLSLAAIAGVDTSALQGRAEAMTAIMRTTAAGTLLTAALVAAVVCLVNPESTAIVGLLRTLPVNHRMARFGVQAPSMIIGVAFALILCAPFLRIVIGSASSVLRAVAAVLILLMLMLATQMATLSTHRLVTFLAAERLRIPRRYAISLAAAVNIGLALQWSYGI